MQAGLCDNIVLHKMPAKRNPKAKARPKRPTPAVSQRLEVIAKQNQQRSTAQQDRNEFARRVTRQQQNATFRLELDRLRQAVGEAGGTPAIRERIAQLTEALRDEDRIRRIREVAVR